MKTRHTCITTVVFALATAACAGSTPEPQTGPRASAEELAELERLYEARADSARMNVNEADVRFMTGMISHHAQALVMAAMAETHGASAPMLILTGRVTNAQTDEINLMQGWLRDRGRPVPEVEIDGTELLIDGGPPMRMHGMLTDQQMRELDEARGTEWDRLFLTYMIQHHEGAVAMVADLFGTDGAANDDIAFKLASDIQVDQITEIRRMKLMLEELTSP
ncbi:MAG: DUF305 domain-containing protein [Gemmatimonadota bacterium]|nr:DUF305 domain-containing protein [Gemmatimonadota bacterium]